MKFRNKHAFTLIELLIVVAIIAILAAMAVPNLLEAQMRARVSRALTDMRTIGLAIEMYTTDYNQVPIAFGGTYVLPDLSYANDTLRVEGDNRMHNGTLLSTPISYLSEVPYDFFNSNQIPSSGAYWGGRRISFIWWADPIGGEDWEYLPGAEDAEYPVGRHPSQRERWKMESCGPDRQWHNKGQLRITAYLYDPTNGTVSGGQLVYWDGGRINPVR